MHNKTDRGGLFPAFLCLLSLVVLTLVPVSAHAAEEGEKAPKSREDYVCNDIDRLVELATGVQGQFRLDFKVPRSYLTHRALEKGGFHSQLNFKAKFDDMTPDCSRYGSAEPVPKAQAVTISLVGQPEGGKVLQGEAVRILRGGNYRKLGLKTEGHTMYRTADNKHDYLFPDNSFMKAPYIVRCEVSYGDRRYESCQLRFYHPATHLIINMYFDSDLLPELESVYRKSMDLLQVFLVKTGGK